jgi:hypothetical protein
LELDWNEANQPKHLRIELLTEDGQPVTVATPTGDRPVVIEGDVEIGRSPGSRQGASFNLPIAINFGPMPMPPAGRYEWRFSIDGNFQEGWGLPFSTQPAQPQARRQPPRPS